MTDRGDILNEAHALTYGDRRRDYGEPVANMQHIARLASEISGKPITAGDVVAMLLATKLARRTTSPLKKDHYVDLCAYVGILFEVVNAERGDDG